MLIRRRINLHRRRLKGAYWRLKGLQDPGV
jgi:hypothetical protein